MTRLLLPLHCYDEAGRVKPPVWLYVLLLLLCTDWIALVFSLASFGQTSQLLAILYPDKTVLGTRLLATVPFVIVLLLLGNRERLWTRHWLQWRKLIKPLLLIGLASSLTAQVNTMAHERWSFHWTPAVFLLLNLITLLCVIRSKHLTTMVADWRHGDDDSQGQKNLTDADEHVPDQNMPQH